MNGRLRVPAGRPPDPAAARTILVLTGVVCFAFAVVVGLGLLGSGPTTLRSSDPVTVGMRRRSPSATRPAVPPHETTQLRMEASSRPTQDPQDRPGSPAAARARQELRTHRALQDLPWHDDGLSIALVGARGPKAILEVRAPTIRAGHDGYRHFLHAHHDDGRAYLPRFRPGGGGRGR